MENLPDSKQCLIDADCLVYECGFGCETAWGEEGYPNFDFVSNMLDNKINNIVAIAGPNKEPILFLTGHGNFRYEIAKKTPYKERVGNRPFHYFNIRAYIKAKYDYRESEGMEADDLMAIEQTNRPDETIICTRDKDLRQVTGWHYGWEMGSQPSFGPHYVSDHGEIRLTKDRKAIKGEGSLFFFSQLLTGDKVDSIPGLPGMGAVGAFKILEGSVDAKDALRRVYGAYRAFYGPLNAYREMLEQSRLLWMTRKLKRNGEPFLYGQTRDFTKTEERMD